MKRDLIKAVALVVSFVGMFASFNAFRELSYTSAVAYASGEEVTLMYAEMWIMGILVFGFVVAVSYILSGAIVNYVYGRSYND